MRRRDVLAMLLAAGSPEAAVLMDVKTRRVLVYRNEAAARVTTAPPGSTMKPIVLAALMKSGKLREADAFPCPVTLTIAGRQLNCSHPRMALPMRVETALAYSCNCVVARMAERLSPGDLPLGRRVSGVDALRLQALGEDSVAVTVMELAEAYRQLALTAPPAVVSGLEGAVEYGTAQRARMAGVTIAGKTGTSHGAAWFAGWMPSRSPEVVVVARAAGRSGGADAAPIAAEMLRSRR